MSRSLVRRFLSILSGKMVALILSALATPLIVRMLGSTAYGNYAFLMSTFGILSMISNFGMSQSLRKFFPEQQDDEWKYTVVTFYFYLTLSISFIIFLVGSISIQSSFLAEIFDSRLSNSLYLVLILVVLMQVFSLCRSVLMASGKEHKSEPLLILKKILFLALGLSFLYLGFEVPGLMAGHILATLFTVSVGLAFALPYFNRRYLLSIPISRGQVKHFLSFSALSALAIFLLTSLYHVDVVLIRYFLDGRSTGYYKAALISAEFLWFVPYAIQTLFIHSTSELWSKEKQKEITEITSLATKYGVLLTILLAVGLAVLREPFIHLYFGRDFTPAIMPLLVLIPGAMGFAVVRPIYATNYSRGRIRAVILATGGAAALNLLLNFIFIPTFGITGAALATSIGYGTMLIFHLRLAYRFGYSPTQKLKIGRIVTVTFVLSVVLFILNGVIEFTIWKLIILPPSGALTFLVCSYKLGLITKTEIRKLRNEVW